VKIGVVPVSPKHRQIGVMLRRGPDSEVVVAPDEARTIAADIEDEDPDTATRLREVAKAVEEFVRKGLPPGGGSVAVVRPKITGPEALLDWVWRWWRDFQRAYQSARAQGWPATTVVAATPTTQSLDDPPAAFHFFRPAEVNAILVTLNLGPQSRNVPPDAFFVLATCAGGRFQGAFAGILPASGTARPAMPEDN
jgi:hypothetical protein